MLDIEAAARREERAQQHRGWLAWHTAALGRVKRFPKLKAILGFKPKTPVPQSQDEMIAAAEAWKKAFSKQPKPGARRKT